MMARSDKNPEVARGSGGRELNFLPDNPVALTFLLLLLAAAGAVIIWLFGSLGAALGACFWALWAAAAFTIGASLVRRISARRAKRHQKEPEPSAPELKNLESIPATEQPAAKQKGERKRHTYKLIFIIEKITDDKKG
jgi:hypothetical protein